MSTRSDIIVQLQNGSWKRIYCHWDGYLSHNGKILAAHYASQERAEALVQPGDLSSLAPQCDKPRGHSFAKPVKGHCVYYGRDRGETDTAGTIGASLSEVWPPEDTWTEFTYVWSRSHGNPSGEWYVADADGGSQGLARLCDALDGTDRPHPLIKVPMAGMTLGRHS